MNNNTHRFRMIITWFGTLPWIIVLYLACILVPMMSLLPLAQNYIITSEWFASLVIIVTWGLGIFLSYCIGILVKYLYYKPRPVVMNTSTTWSRINAWSMPSIHSSNSMICGLIAAFSYIGLVDTPTDQDLIISALITLTIYWLIGYSRIALRKHFVVDVIIWWAMGICITYYTAMYLSVPLIQFVTQAIGL